MTMTDSTLVSAGTGAQTETTKAQQNKRNAPLCQTDAQEKVVNAPNGESEAPMRRMNALVLVCWFPSLGKDVVGVDPVAMCSMTMVAIIGPQTSQEAEFVAQMCIAAQVPMLCFSATDLLLSQQRFPYFIRLSHSDAVQMKAIATVVKRYNWWQVGALYADNDFGAGVLSSLSEALIQVGSQLSYRCPIPVNASTDYIRAELYELMTKQTRVFVVYMSFLLGQKIFSTASEIGMMGEGYVWIITDGSSSILDILKPSDLDSMKGALAARASIRTSTDDFPKRWEEKIRREVIVEDRLAKINIYA